MPASTLLTSRRDRCREREVARLGPGRRVARHVGVPEHPGHLLDHVVDPIGSRTHIGPIRRHEHGQPGSLGHRTRAEPDRVQKRRDLRTGQRHTDLALDAGDRHAQRERLGDVPADVEHAVTDRETRARSRPATPTNRLTAASMPQGSQPRSKRAEASVRRPSRLEVRAMAMGVK